MRLDRKIILPIFGLDISPFIMASTESLVGFVLNTNLKHFGDIYVSALAVMQSAMQVGSTPLTGFAQGFIPVVSYNYGHGSPDRVKECFRISVVIMFTFNAVLMTLMILFPHVVASAFTRDTELVGCVSGMMPYFLSGMTIFGLQRACQNTFIALGQAKISLFIALLRKVILLVPLAVLLPGLWGVKGVFAAESIADATAAICCVASRAGNRSPLSVLHYFPGKTVPPASHAVIDYTEPGGPKEKQKLAQIIRQHYQITLIFKRFHKFIPCEHQI